MLFTRGLNLVTWLAGWVGVCVLALSDHSHLLYLLADEPDYRLQSISNMNESSSGPIQLKLLCGADLLESFGTPGLWQEQDVSNSLIYIHMSQKQLTGLH